MIGFYQSIKNGKNPFDASGSDAILASATHNVNVGESTYMECSPTDASEETIEMYNVPIHGEFANDLSKLNMFRMIIYMFFMLMLFEGRGSERGESRRNKKKASNKITTSSTHLARR